MPGVQTCALDRKSTRLNSSDTIISYAVFCLKKEHGVRVGVPVGGRQNADEAELGVEGVEPAVLTEAHPGDVVVFFNDPATTEIYTLSLHDALPINDTATTEIYTLSLHDALPISVVAVS